MSQISDFRQPSIRTRPLGRLYLLLLLLSLALYASTAQRAPAWQDSGTFQWRSVHLDLTGWLGLALSHPLLILLGKMFSFLPFGPVPWRINLVSAVAGAVTVANIGVLVRRLAPDRPAAAWIAAGSYGLAHTPWWLATVCESQALYAALFTTQLHILLSLSRRPGVSWAALLGIASGIAFNVHNLSLLALPVYGIVLVVMSARRRMTYAAVGAFVAGWLAGALFFLVLIILRATQFGLAEAIHSALVGRYAGAVVALNTKTIVLGLGYILYNFPNLTLPLAAIGIWFARKHRQPYLTSAMTALTLIYLLFAIRYDIPDQFMFFLPFYAMVCIWAGLALPSVRLSVYRWLSGLAIAAIVLTFAIYLVAPAVVKALDLQVPGRTDLPRNSAKVWLQPWKFNEDSTSKFAARAMEEAAPNGTIIADFTSIYPLLWLRDEEGVAPGVTIVNVEVPPEAVPAGTPDVFLVSIRKGDFPPWLFQGPNAPQAIRPPGQLLYRLVWPSAPSRPTTQPELPK